MTIEEAKKWIDAATYEQLLSKWRFAPVGSLWFKGEVGEYFVEAMKQRKEAIGNEAHSAASKSIGWE